MGWDGNAWVFGELPALGRIARGERLRCAFGRGRRRAPHAAGTQKSSPAAAPFQTLVVIVSFAGCEHPLCS